MSQYVVKIVATLNDGCYSNGTGFLCSSQGHILTCAHNVVHMENCFIYYQKQLYDATLIAIDNRIDVCILKIEIECGYPKIAMLVQYGKCHTYGYHHDNVCLSYQEGSIMTLNYVSNYAIDSTLTTIKGFKGASGSPLFNEQNEVVGIFSYESSIGCGGVVSRLLQTFLSKVNNVSRSVIIEKSHIGYTTQAISIDEILQNNIEPLKKQVKGERVTSILRKQNNIEVNDIIISINNNIVGRGYISSESYVLYMKKGSKIKIEYLQHKQNYKCSNQIINLIEFPLIFNKPLDDTTILSLSF